MNAIGTSSLPVRSNQMRRPAAPKGQAPKATQKGDIGRAAATATAAADTDTSIGQAALPGSASTAGPAPKIDWKMMPHVQSLYNLLEQVIRNIREKKEALLAKLRKDPLSEKKRKKLKELESAIESAVRRAKALAEKIKTATDPSKAMTVEKIELRKCVDELEKLESTLNALGVSTSELSGKFMQLKSMLVCVEHIRLFAKKGFYGALAIYVKAKDIIAGKEGKLGEKDIKDIFGLEKLSRDAYSIIFHGGDMSDFEGLCNTIAHNVNSFGTSFVQYCESENIVLVRGLTDPVVEAFGQKNSSIFESKRKLNKALDALRGKINDWQAKNIRDKEHLVKIFESALEMLRENSKPEEIKKELAACTVRAIGDYIKYELFKDANGEDPKIADKKYDEFIKLAKDNPTQFSCLVRLFLTGGGFTKEEFAKAMDGKLPENKIPAPILTKVKKEERPNPDLAAVPVSQGKGDREKEVK